MHMIMEMRQFLEELTELSRKERPRSSKPSKELAMRMMGIEKMLVYMIHSEEE